MKSKVNWDFIRELEGFSLKGYVPKDRDINDKTPSGVTIVGGFDIGQHNKDEIKALGLSNSLCHKILPYATITGDKARALLITTPLILTEAEGVELDNCVKDSKLKSVVSEYNANSNLNFYKLEEPMQTVIASVAFQYGSLKKRTPRFFKSITQGDWSRAYNELKNFGDSYQSRRLKEAEYLRKVL